MTTAPVLEVAPPAYRNMIRHYDGAEEVHEVGQGSPFGVDLLERGDGVLGPPHVVRGGGDDGPLLGAEDLEAGVSEPVGAPVRLDGAQLPQLAEHRVRQGRGRGAGLVAGFHASQRGMVRGARAYGCAVLAVPGEVACPGCRRFFGSGGWQATIREVTSPGRVLESQAQPGGVGDVKPIIEVSQPLQVW